MSQGDVPDVRTDPGGYLEWSAKQIEKELNPTQKASGLEDDAEAAESGTKPPP